MILGEIGYTVQIRALDGWIEKLNGLSGARGWMRYLFSLTMDT